MKKTFQLSDPVWWGFNLEIELNDFYNLDDIINYVIENLEATLKSLNLLPQAEMLKNVKSEFHIHGITFEDLIINKHNEDIVYICRHKITINDTIKIEN